MQTLDKVKEVVSDYLRANPNKSIEDITIACLGLAFKPNIDDLRGSPAMGIAENLIAENLGRVICVEPNLPDSKPTNNLADFSDSDCACTENGGICKEYSANYPCESNEEPYIQYTKPNSDYYCPSTDTCCVVPPNIEIT